MSKLILFAGPNGSGKTTLYYKWLSHGGFETLEYINPDEYALEPGSDIWENALA